MGLVPILRKVILILNASFINDATFSTKLHYAAAMHHETKMCQPFLNESMLSNVIGLYVEVPFYS